MKNNYRWTAALAALLCFSLVATACGTGGGSKEETASGTGDEQPAAAEGSGDAANAPAAPAADADPYFGKYDPPIEISTVRIIGELKFKDGEDIDNNQWTRTLSERLGIKVNNQWVVKNEQGAEKMNVTIASGDLPDFFQVNATQLNQLVEAGQVMDITDVYEKHATPLVKGFMNDATNALASAAFDGRLMAFPSPGSTLDASPILWIRKDWLDRLGLPEPKSMNDVLAIAEAFAAKDPDGNGQNDTYGLALMKNLYGAYGALEGFMNGYNAYPQTWVKAADGTLAFGSVQPEMKTALAALQTMFKNGLIDREFGVKDEAKAGELAASGKVGMTYGAMWISLDMLKNSKANDPNADWQAYPLVNESGALANAQIPSLAVGSYYVVRKDAEHPEALIKMLNLFGELQFGPDTPADVWQAHSKVDGIEVWPYYPFLVGQPNKNLGIHKRVVEALDKKDPTGLNAEETDAYNNSLAVEEGRGDPNAWGYDKVFGRKGSYEVIKRYVENDLLKPGEFYGVNTPTMAERGETLKKMEIETFTKIILGDSIDTFDKFVEDWKKLGGDRMTQEVNEWYTSR
ncbi:extracellular solute-binding protein [Paenibacillus antri]|uniref:Extracellular solute-binding protein n=1 Tax=Paenibacillus antri TaxID=2582848 RepID=A0A5R9G7Q7_9BACL|nr:extracellular solute-binding protein [Paenibacillus antri]TLS48783.1 extracellular solute-binding protein [Paenibacillus antri]